MQQVINNGILPCHSSTEQQNATIPTNRSSDQPRNEHQLQIPSNSYLSEKGKYKNPAIEGNSYRPNYVSTSNNSINNKPNSSGFGGRILNRSKFSNLNRDDNRREVRDSQSGARSGLDDDREVKNKMDVDQSQNHRDLNTSNSADGNSNMTLNLLQSANLLAPTYQQASQLHSKSSLTIQIPSVSGQHTMTAPVNSNILQSKNNGIVQNVSTQNFEYQKNFQQQQRQIANLATLTQPGYMPDANTRSAPPLSSISQGVSEPVIHYRQLLKVAQISHGIVRQIFQTPITPLDVDPSSFFSVPLHSSTTQFQRLQQASHRYTENIDRMYNEIMVRNATLGLSRSIWEKMAKREFVDLAQFHPDSLLETASIPNNVRVQLIPDQDGNLRLSFLDDLQSPLSALAQTFSASSLLSATATPQKRNEIKSFSGWFKAWNRYMTANVILFSEDFTQMKEYPLIVAGYAEQFRWGNVQRFDNARRTIHAADTHDILTNDISTIRAQCLVPEARLDCGSSVQAQAFLDSFGKTKRPQLNIRTEVNNSTLTSPRSANYNSEYRTSPISPAIRSPMDHSLRSPRVSISKHRNSISGRHIPQSGSINNIQICGEFNGRRGCARKHCSYLHICAVCAGTEHGRFTCVGKTMDPYPIPTASIKRNEERAPTSPSRQTSSQNRNMQDQMGWRVML